MEPKILYKYCMDVRVLKFVNQKQPSGQRVNKCDIHSVNRFTFYAQPLKNDENCEARGKVR